MGPFRIRIPVALSLVLLPAGAGVVAVHASPTCEHLVQTYITVPVRNKVSAATAKAWAGWRVGHPLWKPSPKVHRPRWVMTRRELMEKVAFACKVESESESAGQLLPEIPPVLWSPVEMDQAQETAPSSGGPEELLSSGYSGFLAGPSGYPMGGGGAGPGFGPGPGLVGGGTPAGGAPGAPGGSAPAPSGLVAGLLPILTGAGTAQPDVPVLPGPGQSAGPGQGGPGESAAGVPVAGPPIAATPEPASFVLLAMGIGWVWVRRQRKLFV